ncbi:hypothetical protein BDZ94DRAFT_1160912 [Collybia nuda]|uniref:Reverse transcriptase zinc-binding domain-containing protein n=1 Tax=Collybia nuda TaxID=64659 RepID=A0A9P5Y7E1_9AGAR|nr:hypothetical protein BDZ94DRAFT_1160912 [Collybia nuda]
MTIFINGAYNLTEHGEATSGGGAWIQENSNRNLSIRINDTLASKDSGELTTILESSYQITSGTQITFIIQSPTILKNLTINLASQESRGWINTQDKTLYKAIVAELRLRGSPTLLRTYNPRETKQKNLAKILAQEGLQKQQNPENHPQPIPELDISGICLAGATQALLYKGIQEQRKTAPRRKTLCLLDRSRYAAKQLSGKTMTDAELWKSIRQRSHLPKGIRNFLWKNLHDAFKIGEYWRNIPTLEHQGYCNLRPNCLGEETMEHILLECQVSSATNLWKIAKTLWLKKDPKWPEIIYGIILACNTADFQARGKTQPGKNRLFAIIISETAYLIWKIRCERVFQGDKPLEAIHSKKALENRWLQCINTCLKLDQLQANHSKYGKKAMKESLVMDTWSGILMDEENLPKNWIWQSSVLVGIDPH